MARANPVTPPPARLAHLSAEQLTDITRATVGHYDSSAERFWHGTKDHDVSQNVEALLRHLEGAGPQRILDLGCGPGRDLMDFKQRGHQPVGLDGSAQFVAMARVHSGCEVLHQDFLALDLEDGRFDGVFANAALFHVPTQVLPRVLGELQRCLADGGVLFTSNPRGNDVEEWHGERYGAYSSLERWRQYMLAAGFEELEHYYRPTGQPRHLQPWLASVWRAV